MMVTGSPAVGTEGQSIVLQFVITDADPLVKVENIRWQFSSLGKDLDITESSNSHYHLSNDRRTLVINQLTTEQIGIYTLFATNEAGVRSNSITVTIEGTKLIVSI